MASHEGSFNQDALANQLQHLLLALEASGHSVLPGLHEALLQSVVEAAARIFGAAASSIALVNEERQTLDFKVACGAGQDQVVGMSIPLDTGIAGYVAMTGQPIAVSNVEHDARFDHAFASSTGYVPRSILATPLISGERVIGVMEVLDKISAPSFGLQDMELLGIFANQAAIAIHLSQEVEELGQALAHGLQKLADSALPGGAPELAAALKLDDKATVRQDLLALSDLLGEVGALGETERQACLKILAAFRDYARAKRPAGF